MSWGLIFAGAQNAEMTVSDWPARVPIKGEVIRLAGYQNRAEVIDVFWDEVIEKVMVRNR